eukprot:jgi/Mesvir1/23848/Mv10651-RA.1
MSAPFASLVADLGEIGPRTRVSSSWFDECKVGGQPVKGFNDDLAASGQSGILGGAIVIALCGGRAPALNDTRRRPAQGFSTTLVMTDGFAYIPPHVRTSLASRSGSFLLVIERRYAPATSLCEVDRPSFQVGYTSQQPLLPAAGEIFKLRKLLPTTPEYDFNIHVMDFEPGEYLNVEELHYNQHGLVLLQGEGIYRLSDKWYPVTAGDVIWMAPFVTQWYGALGKTMSRYILYKDVNRDPLFVD